MVNTGNEIVALFLKFFRELIKKIDDEVLLLAFGLAVAITLIAIFTQHFYETVGITFTQIFLIATIYFLLVKTLKIFYRRLRKRKRKKG